MHRVALMLACHLVLHQVLAHPYEDQVLVRHDLAQGVGRLVDPGACPVAEQRGYCQGVGRHFVDRDAVPRRSLLWIGKDYFRDVEQQALDRAWEPVCQRLVLALGLEPLLLEPVCPPVLVLRQQG